MDVTTGPQRRLVTTHTRHPSWPKIIRAAYLREEENVTQAEAGAAVGVTARTVRNWESDEKLWAAAIEAEGDPGTEPEPETGAETEAESPRRAHADPRSPGAP